MYFHEEAEDAIRDGIDIVVEGMDLSPDLELLLHMVGYAIRDRLEGRSRDLDAVITRHYDGDPELIRSVLKLP